MPTGMHYIYTEVYNDYISGREYRAKKLFESILPILSFSNQHLDISINFFKKLIHEQGIYSTKKVRKAGKCFDEVHERISDELIMRALRLESDIKETRKES